MHVWYCFQAIPRRGHKLPEKDFIFQITILILGSRRRRRGPSIRAHTQVVGGGGLSLFGGLVQVTGGDAIRCQLRGLKGSNLNFQRMNKLTALGKYVCI